MDFCDMAETVRRRDLEPLPRLPLVDLMHWRDVRPSRIEEKNAEAIARYQERARDAGLLADEQEHLRRVRSGIEAIGWVTARSSD